MKKSCLWVASSAALLVGIGIVLMLWKFPLALAVPPSQWPLLAKGYGKWYWDRSHVSGIPSLAPPSPLAIAPSYSDVFLTPDNLPAMTELARFSPDSETVGPVAALALTPDGQVLLAAYAQEDLLRRWRVEDGELLATFDVGPVCVAATAFDGQGRLLATAMGRTPRAGRAGYTVDTYDTRLWDTQTGELAWEISLNAEYTSNQGVSGVALSEDGQWLAAVAPLEHSESLLYTCNTVSQDCSFISLGGTLEVYVTYDREHWLAERRIWQTPDVVTFDPAREIVALADREGRITFYWWDADRNAFWSWPRVDIDWEKANDYTVPLALEFDRSRRWLAVVRGEQFELWSLGGEHIRRTLSADIPAAATSDVTFSPMSDLVAVGTSAGWQIWDVNHGKKLAEGGASPVFALTFSPDGRLFVWGDENGVLHIWGVPTQ